MPLFKNQFGEEVNLPETERTRALSSGYTAIDAAPTQLAPTTQPIAPTAPAIAPPPVQTSTVTKMPRATEAPITGSSSPGAGYIKGYDTKNQGAQVWVKAGQYYPGVSLYPKATTEITPERMKTEEKITLPGATPS